MKNIYVIYGKPASGKSHFARNFIYNEETDLYEYSEINELNFINKYADIENYYKHYNNLIIDEVYCSANSQVFAYKILKHANHFNNLILICFEPNDVSKLIARLVDPMKEKPEVRYLKIERKLGE